VVYSRAGKWALSAVPEAYRTPWNTRW